MTDTVPGVHTSQTGLNMVDTGVVDEEQLE
jgi:hypothetical protein